MEIKTEGLPGEKVAKRMFFLAYQACKRPFGMGYLQAVEDASEEDVWANVLSSGDYPCKIPSKSGEVYGDYVFGRMMKLKVWYERDSVTVPSGEADKDYQAWSRDSRYNSYEALAKEAIKSLKG